MSKHTPVPAFLVLYRILFTCLRCGTAVEMKQSGVNHVASSDHCPQCGVYYVAQWEQPLEQSQVLLVEDEGESEATL